MDLDRFRYFGERLPAVCNAVTNDPRDSVWRDRSALAVEGPFPVILPFELIMRFKEGLCSKRSRPHRTRREAMKAARIQLQADAE